MARATVTATALKQLIDDVEAIRIGMRAINEKYRNKDQSDHPVDNNWEDDYDMKRDWYLRLIECGAKNIMLEQEDWAGYFHHIGTNLVRYEEVADHFYQESQKWKAAVNETNCPVFADELPPPDKGGVWGTIRRLVD